MPINNVIQPDKIIVSDRLNLIKYDWKNDYNRIIKWYSDEETLMLVNGNTNKYDCEQIDRMYDYQSEHGELYFIEYDGEIIGDVTFSQQDMPIVIGEKSLRHSGIGLAVIKKLIERAKSIGYDKIFVQEIYDYNVASQKLFKKAGFTE